MLEWLFGGKRAERTSAPFRFTVQDVFYIKPPVDRVILVGMIDQGEVTAGDELVVHTRTGPVSVKVDGLESIHDQPKRATAGQQIGLRLSGIAQHQAWTGDVVTGQ